MANEQDEKKTLANSGLQHEGAKQQSEPIVDNWSDIPFDGGDVELSRQVKMIGSTNLTINPDGSYNFSGQIPKTFPAPGDQNEYRIDIVFGIKSSEGTTLLFPHSAVVGITHPDNYVWNKQGSNNTVKDNFAAFAKDHYWHASIRFSPITTQDPSGGGSGEAIGDVIDGLGVVASIIAFL